MIAMFGSWLGLESPTTTTASIANNDASASDTADPTPSGAIRISSPHSPTKRARTSPTNSSTSTASKSEELLCDYDLLSFLCTVDERIKIYETPIVDKDTLERLDALQTQASLDGCDVLSDIIECLQDENEKLKRVVAERRFGGPAENPIYSTAPAGSASLIST